MTYLERSQVLSWQHSLVYVSCDWG